MAKTVRAPEDGDGIDVLLLKDEKVRVDHLSAEAVKGTKILSGWTSGDAYPYRLEVRNRNKGEISVHAAVVRDFRSYKK